MKKLTLLCVAFLSTITMWASKVTAIYPAETVTNAYGWCDKNDMFMDWEADMLKHLGRDASLAISLDSAAKSSDIYVAVTIAPTTLNKFFSTEPYATKWKALHDYLIAVADKQNSEGVLGANGQPVPTIKDKTDAYWRYALNSFWFQKKQNSWPYSADFSVAGQPKAFMKGMNMGFCVTEDYKRNKPFVLGIPYKAGEKFLGWYDNANFLGNPLSEENIIAMAQKGDVTLYAKMGIERNSELEVGCGDVVWITAMPEEGYHFVKWNDNNTENPRAITVNSDSTFVASFAINQYLIQFVNSDQTFLWSDSVNHGVLPVYGGQTPTMQTTAQYTFVFSGWEPTLVNAVEDATYTALYDSIVNEYQIIFKNHDGTTLQTSSIQYGQLPEYTSSTPTKEATTQYTFVFSGWSPQVDTVKSDAEYIAQFDTIVNQYAITYLNDNGDTLMVDSVAYGTLPVYAGETPTKEATAQYTFAFSGWSPTLVEVTGDATYTATYTSSVQRYDLILEGENGVVTGAGNYQYGDTVRITATANECYAFVKWSDDDSTAVRDIIIIGETKLTAVFETIKYTIKVVSENESYGTVNISATKPDED